MIIEIWQRSEVPEDDFSKTHVKSYLRNQINHGETNKVAEPSCPFQYKAWSIGISSSLQEIAIHHESADSTEWYISDSHH